MTSICDIELKINYFRLGVLYYIFQKSFLYVNQSFLRKLLYLKNIFSNISINLLKLFLIYKIGNHMHNYIKFSRLIQNLVI